MVIRNNPNTVGTDSTYLEFTGGEHVVLGGTTGNDTLKGGNGIDTLWGDAGNDRLDGGNEADQVHGGDGDDIITDAGTPAGGADFLHGDEGNDVISSGMGNDIVFGGGGNDFIITGNDLTEVFAGRGDDFVLGGVAPDGLMGNEGNDWLEGGDGFDGLSGENSELFFNSPIIGHDVLNGQGNDTDYDGESGDDIMVQGPGIQRSNGMFGFDWAIHKGDTVAANSDLGIPFFPAQAVFTLRDRFDSVEGLSGWDLDDTLQGAGVLKGAAGGAGAGPGNPVDESHLFAKNVGLIDGLAELLGHDQAFFDAVAAAAVLTNTNGSVLDTTLGAEILLGGGGSDTITGKLGDDIIDGDKWLNVRIAVTGVTGLTSVESMNDIKARMLSGEINPGQLSIVREIIDGGQVGDVDVAAFSEARANYTLTVNPDGSITVTHDVVTGLVDDGSDTVRNIEVLRFADGDVSTVNSPATGEVVIIGEAIENGLLFADTSTISDVNGALAFSFQWFRAGVLIAGAIGETYEPVDADKGLALTVEVVAVDELGFSTTFTSDPTAAVINVDVGTNGNDLMIGTALPDQLFGLGGNDTLNGGDGNDSLFGGAGNDFINGQVGNDIMDGDTGNDTFVVNSLADVVVEAAGAGGGTDTVQAWVNGYTLANNVENLLLVLPSGLNGNGNALNNTITGNTQANVINGGGGNDTINGLAGNDTLDGGTGTDRLVGGTDNDTYVVDSTADVVIEAAGEGTDSVSASASYTLSANVENLTLTGVANLSGTGNGQDNVVTGNGGANLLSGVAGNDTLIGGGGNDTLSGGAGKDFLTGGTGNDIFDFDTPAQAGSGATRDVITDFTAGDRIDVSGMDANTAGILGFLVNEAFSATVVAVGGPGAAFSANSQLHYYFDGVNTIIEGNVNGNQATAEFQIQVAGNHTFTAADFIL